MYPMTRVNITQQLTQLGGKTGFEILCFYLIRQKLCMISPTAILIGLIQSTPVHTFTGFFVT